MNNNLTGFLVSAFIHLGLILLILAGATRLQTSMVHELPTPLKLAMFQPSPPSSTLKSQPFVENFSTPIVAKSVPKPEALPLNRPESKAQPKPRTINSTRPKQQLAVKPQPVVEKSSTPLVAKSVPRPEALPLNKPKSKPQPKPRTKPKPQPTLQKQAVAIPESRIKAPKVSEPFSVASNMHVPTSMVPNHALIQRVEEEYKIRLRAAIEARKKYPRRARRLRHQGSVSVSFKVQKNGSINEMSVVSSSNSLYLDKAALETVQLVSTLFPLPEELNRTEWAFIIPIKYNLR